MSDKYFSAIAKMKIKVKELVYASENSELKEVVKHVEDRLKEKADSFIDVAINEAILEVLEEPFIVDDETWATIEDAKQQIIDGEIDVPEFSYSAE